MEWYAYLFWSQLRAERQHFSLTGALNRFWLQQKRNSDHSVVVKQHFWDWWSIWKHEWVWWQMFKHLEMDSPRIQTCENRPCLFYSLLSFLTRNTLERSMWASSCSLERLVLFSFSVGHRTHTVVHHLSNHLAGSIYFICRSPTFFNGHVIRLFFLFQIINWLRCSWTSLQSLVSVPNVWTVLTSGSPVSTSIVEMDVRSSSFSQRNVGALVGGDRQSQKRKKWYIFLKKTKWIVANMIWYNF